MLFLLQSQHELKYSSLEHVGELIYPNFTTDILSWNGSTVNKLGRIIKIIKTLDVSTDK